MKNFADHLYLEKRKERHLKGRESRVNYWIFCALGCTHDGYKPCITQSKRESEIASAIQHLWHWHDKPTWFFKLLMNYYMQTWCLQHSCHSKEPPDSLLHIPKHWKHFNHRNWVPQSGHYIYFRGAFIKNLNSLFFVWCLLSITNETPFIQEPETVWQQNLQNLFFVSPHQSKSCKSTKGQAIVVCCGFGCALKFDSGWGKAPRARNWCLELRRKWSP